MKTVKRRTITIDDRGYSRIAEVNGEVTQLGPFGAGLQVGDTVLLDDDSLWSVDMVADRIHTGNPARGESDYVYVDLIGEE